jgi:pimeloyl-ACP methyl ester carboxylesterase
LVVLIHGFQGNSFDMKLLKNNLLLYKPELLIYCSSKNEDNTEGDILEMGKKLAEEILEYIRDFCPGSALGRISFIGYSLGGLIARASLQHLQSLHSKMHTFITLSSPHISFLYSSSSLIDAGMWILKKLKKSDALLQLTMSDTPEMKDTLVYKMSQTPELGLFKNVVLFGSDQDTYCPFDSATIQIAEDVSRDRG